MAKNIKVEIKSNIIHYMGFEISGMTIYKRNNDIDRTLEELHRASSLENAIRYIDKLYEQIKVEKSIKKEDINKFIDNFAVKHEITNKKAKEVFASYVKNGNL